MTPQGQNPPTGINKIPRLENVYIMQEPAEVLKNGESVEGYISLPSQTQIIKKPWNNRQLERIKYRNTVF